jgi:hypothetical protein
MTYKEWIKTLNCIVCEAPGPSDPHHLIGDGQGIMARTSPDELLMPMCRKHHDQIHELSRHMQYVMYGFTQEEMVCRTIRRAVYEGWKMRQKT